MKLKVGLLGAGYISEAHASALAEITSVSIHAVCDQSSSRATRVAARFRVPHVFTSIDELAASDCDVVHVLLPPAHHLEAARKLIESGKSVFLEKPMGLDSVQCEALSALAVSSGCILGVNHNFLFSRGYEALRARVKAGEMGRIDHLSVNWHYALPILQFGPFDNWMVAAPANIVFEVGSHAVAFAVDLVGEPEIKSALADNPIKLPAAQLVYRHWAALGRSSAAAVHVSLSLNTGHEDRYLRIRGRAGSAQLDFGRDIYWTDTVVRDNPLFDSYESARSTAQQVGALARNDRLRRLRSALAKRPGANAFEESMQKSIAAFYAGGLKQVDPRHSGTFGASVIRVCEQITCAAGIGAPSITGVSISIPQSSLRPTVLVVGGTGFIGRRLVRGLAAKGVGVRVLTRNARAAAIELSGLDVDILGGSHGDPDCVERALPGIEVVYHLAKCEGKRWQDYLSGDIEPTRVLAEGALRHGIKRFIYTGTIASYASDDPGALIDNNTPIDPAIESRGYYARSKAECERLLQELQRALGLPLVIVRPAIVIGPGTPPAHLGVGKFSSETRVDFWGDGMSSLPLVLVDDVADALVLALDAPGIDGQTLLLTSPPLMNAREYVAAVAEHMGTRIDARPRSAWRNWCADLIKEVAKNAVRHPNRRWPTLHDAKCQSNCSRYDGRMSERALNWKPVDSREEMIRRGIAEAVDWFVR